MFFESFHRASFEKLLAAQPRKTALQSVFTLRKLSRTGAVREQCLKHKHLENSPSNKAPTLNVHKVILKVWQVSSGRTYSVRQHLINDSYYSNARKICNIYFNLLFSVLSPVLAGLSFYQAKRKLINNRILPFLCLVSSAFKTYTSFSKAVTCLSRSFVTTTRS